MSASRPRDAFSAGAFECWLPPTTGAGETALVVALACPILCPMAPRTPIPRKSATSTALGRRASLLFDWLVMQTLPVHVVHGDDINVLRMLVAAGLAKAGTSDGRAEEGGAVSEPQPPATVFALTQEGYRWRKNQDPPKDYSIL